MQNPVTHAEHGEFEKRIEAEMQRLADEDKRQNKRIESLEAIIPKLNEISLQIKDLYGEIKNIVKEMQINHERMDRQSQRMNKQDEEIDGLKNRDGEQWREVQRYIIAAIAGGIVTLLFPMLKGG